MLAGLRTKKWSECEAQHRHGLNALDRMTARLGNADFDSGSGLDLYPMVREMTVAVLAAGLFPIHSNEPAGALPLA